MFPKPTELLLIGCLIESIWSPRSKSKTLTPKTNSPTYWQREISHVMNGIIFCVCLTLAISVLLFVLKWCRKEHEKNQVKKESQQNRNRWWIWSRDAAKGLLLFVPLPHQKARGRSWNEQHQRTGSPVFRRLLIKLLRVECWNWRKFRRGTWPKSKVRNKWSMKQRRRALQFIMHH